VKKLSFAELCDEAELLKDCRTEDVETARGIVTLASCSSQGILDWFAENESEDAETRKFKGLRLIVRCIINPDGTRVVNAKEDVASAIALLKRRGAHENGRLLDVALRINGLTATKGPELKNVSSEPTDTTASSTDSPVLSVS